MRRVVLVTTILAACASPPPIACTTPIDSSGRGLPLCHAANDTPVCDTPGATAHYEMNALGGYSLTGGTTAACDDSNQVVCADRTISPHCITQPVDPP